jgi:hypothetical protein
MLLAPKVYSNSILDPWPRTRTAACQSVVDDRRDLMLMIGLPGLLLGVGTMIAGTRRSDSG